MKVIGTGIEGLKGVETDVGWLARGGIAAEMNVGQAYTVKHIRKGLTLLNQKLCARLALRRNCRGGGAGYGA